MIDVKELRERAEVLRYLNQETMAIEVLELLDALEATQRMLAERSETVLEQNKMIVRQFDDLVENNLLISDLTESVTRHVEIHARLEKALEAADGLLYEVDKHKRGSLMLFKARDKYRAARNGK